MRKYALKKTIGGFYSLPQRRRFTMLEDDYTLALFGLDHFVAHGP